MSYNSRLGYDPTLVHEPNNYPTREQIAQSNAYLLDQFQLGAAEGITWPVMLTDIPHMVSNWTLDTPNYEAASHAVAPYLGYEGLPLPQNKISRENVSAFAPVARLGASLPGPISYIKAATAAPRAMYRAATRATDVPFDQSRADFMGTLGKGILAATTPIVATKVAQKLGKPAHVTDTRAGGWDKIIDELYDKEMAAARRDELLSSKRVQDAAAHKWATNRNALGPNTPPYNPKDYPPEIAAKVEEIRQLDEMGVTHMRDPRTKFLRDKGRTHPSGSVPEYARLNREADLEYAARRMMPPNKLKQLDDYTTAKEMGITFTPAQQRHYDALTREFKELQDPELARQYERSLLSKERQIEYDAIERRIKAEKAKEQRLYEEEVRTYGVGEAGARSYDRWMEADGNLNWSIPSKLLRNDPNVSQYRRARAKWRAGKIGDKAWQREADQLMENLEWHMGPAKIEFDAGRRVSYFQINSHNRLRARLQAEYIEPHLELGRRAGISPSKLKKYEQALRDLDEQFLRLTGE